MFSEVARARNANVMARAAAHQRAGLLLPIAIASLVELVAGWQARQDARRVERLIASLGSQIELLPLSQDAAVVAGRVMGDLRRVGQSIGPFDPLIAAIAIQHDRVLVTGNTRHYQRIIDVGYPLRLEDWRQAPA